MVLQSVKECLQMLGHESLRLFNSQMLFKSRSATHLETLNQVWGARLVFHFFFFFFLPFSLTGGI